MSDSAYQQLRSHLAYLGLSTASERLSHHLDAGGSATEIIEALLSEEVTATRARKLASRLPDPNYRTVQPPQDRHLTLTGDVPDESVRAYISAATDAIELREAVGEAQIRYAAAVEDQAFDAAALQASADNGFSMEIVDTIAQKAVQYQNLVDLIPANSTAADDSSFASELSENGLPQPVLTTLTELGFADQELQALRES